MKRLLSLFALAACASTSAGADRHAVAALLARFNDAVSRRDFVAMPEMFVEDAVWEANAEGLGFRHAGRDAIRGWLADNPNQVEVVFYLAGPPVVEMLAGGRARSRTTMTELLRRQDTGDLIQLFGSYEDELVHRDGRWQFTRRRFRLAHMRTL